MKKTWVGTCAAAALVMFAACGGGDDTADDTLDQPAADQPAPQPQAPGGNVQLPDGVTQDMVAAGQQVFNTTTCWTCHGQNGTGGPLAPALNDQTWINIDGEYSSIQEVVRTGVAQPKEHAAPMPAMGGAAMTDEQVNQVAAYVYAISRGG